MSEVRFVYRVLIGAWKAEAVDIKDTLYDGVGQDWNQRWTAEHGHFFVS
jgi:hypothetical protein